MSPRSKSPNFSNANFSSRFVAQTLVCDVGWLFRYDLAALTGCGRSLKRFPAKFQGDGGIEGDAGDEEKEKRELDSQADLQCLAARVLACNVSQRLCSPGC